MTNFELQNQIKKNWNKCCLELNFDPANIGLYYSTSLKKNAIATAHYSYKKSGPLDNFVEFDLNKISRIPESLPEIVAHELAHHAAPGDHHGFGWQKIMTSLGFSGVGRVLH